MDKNSSTWKMSAFLLSSHVSIFGIGFLLGKKQGEGNLAQLRSEMNTMRNDINHLMQIIGNQNR